MEELRNGDGNVVVEWVRQEFGSREWDRKMLIPGYRFLEKSGNVVYAAFKRAVYTDEIALPYALSNCTPDEVARLEQDQERWNKSS